MLDGVMGRQPMDPSPAGHTYGSPSGLSSQECIDRAIDGTSSPGEFSIMPRQYWIAACRDQLEIVQHWCDQYDGKSWPNKDAPTIMPNGPHRVSFLVHAAAMAGPNSTAVLRFLIAQARLTQDSWA